MEDIKMVEEILKRAVDIIINKARALEPQEEISSRGPLLKVSDVHEYLYDVIAEVVDINANRAFNL